MAEHVAGTTMMVIRALAVGIGGATGAMIIQVMHRDIVTVLGLPRGRLPSETGREQRRQQDCEHD